MKTERKIKDGSMKTVLRVFKYDIHDIVSHVFVLITLLAVAAIPSLYAWVNIYANWDPYVNTGNVQFAVASNDHGIDLKDGTYVNSFDKVKKDLKENDKIGWQFPESADAAVEGVKSGKYYAALVFEDGFTYDMHHLEAAMASEKAPITYYQNVKKNGVASKIADMAAESVQSEINTEYLRNVFADFFSDTGNLAEKINSDNAVSRVLKQLQKTRDALSDYDKAVTLFSEESAGIKDALKSAGGDLDNARSKGQSDVAAANRKIKEAGQTVKAIEEELEAKAAKIKNAIENAKTQLSKKGTSDAEKKKIADNAIGKIDKLLVVLEDLRSLVPSNPKTAGGKLVSKTLDHMITAAEKTEKLLGKVPVTSRILSNAKESALALEELYTNSLKPGIGQMTNDIKTAVKNLNPLVSSVGGILDDIYPVLGAAGNTVEGLSGSLNQLHSVLSALQDKLDEIIKEVKAEDKGSQKEKLTELLGGDSKRYGDFFASLVNVKTEKLYPADTYGEAMAPFYTVIALWVGGVMLVTLLKTNVNRKKFPKITETQGFFGRLMAFVLLGQMQAAIVVAGDIFLMDCTPVHPWLMWLSAAITSLVFVTLIYALTLSFGDLGRALAVLLIFVQIAGSSGSYPIEILPEIFGSIYKFFPFPYAINAMREALFGVYGNHFIMYIAELMIFFVVAVVIGIFIRKPFIGVREFMAKKQKETGVM